MIMINRLEIIAKFIIGLAGMAFDCLGILAQHLGKRNIQMPHQRNIKPIQPEHRLLCLITVIMPGHWRGNDKIANLHFCFSPLTAV